MRRTALGAGALIVSLGACDSLDRAEPPAPSATGAALLPAGGPVPAAMPVPSVQAPPALLVRMSPEKASEPLAIARAEVGVVITGFLAETTTTLTFRNPHDRALEGDLVFPLPDGATVSGYALDVAGEMVEGVVVERQEARVAFEQEVRKGIDPGLVEWVKGNNFRTRVWPVPARGARTVRLRYVSELVMRKRGDVLDARYALPLRFRQPIDELALKVEVVRSTTRPEVEGGGIANFRFDTWQDRYVAQARLERAQLSQDLLIALPSVPRESVVIEKDDKGQAYFVIVDFPDVPRVRRPAPKARRVGLFWDASLSREEADHGRERALLETWLQRAGDLDVDVVVFRDIPEPPKTFAVRGGDAGPLVSFLEKLTYDGATNLGALRFTRDHDYDLLFSDGLANFGDKTPPAAEVPVYAVGVDSQADHPLLGHLSRESGGEYLDLRRLGIAEAADSIGSAGLSLPSVDYEAGGIADLIPAGPRRIPGRLALAGRLLAPAATVHLRYGEGSESRSRDYTLRQADASPGRLVPHFWAQQRAAELSVRPERNHDELLALGRQFGIVTPGSSLLVLETVEQYVQHRIEPPRHRAAMLAEYRQRVQREQSTEKKKKADKLARVREMWSRRVQWWEREFRYDGNFKYREPSVNEGVAGAVAGGVPGGVVGGVVGGLPAPPPPAPRAASAPLGTEEMVMVTAAADAVESKKPAGAAGQAVIVLKPWDPATPYLSALRQAGRAGAYAAFLSQRRQYGASPAFYFDCADYFLREGQAEIGRRILSDLVELQLEEPRLLRIAAHRFQQIGALDTAVDLFERVRRLRPEEPQSLRDLALSLEARADAGRQKTGKGSPGIAVDYLKAVDLLNRVVLGDWDGRFPEVEVIALEEANRIMAIVERDPGFGPASFPVDARLRKVLDTDLRIVMTWDTDETDMDLWVTEPSGEKCFYSHALTVTGGMISNDFTGGYGPEEYLVRRAMAGEYRIQANFYGSNAQTLTGPTTVQATVITHFGRSNEERRSLTLRLTEAKEVIDVGTARFAP